AGSALGHSFTNYVADGNATCTADGTKTAKCDRCDATDTIADTGSATGHHFGAWTDAGANHERVCPDCETKETAAHTFGDWVVTKPATEKAEGEQERICTVCGHTETAKIDKLPATELTLSALNVGPANKIAVTVPYTRKGQTAVQLTASETGVKYSVDEKGSKILQVDENTGEIRFVRLSIFTKNAVITAKTADGKTAQCEVKVQLRWYHYILFLLFGFLWY
ncbi:MAG: hypothetical protein IKR49_08515, partial [Clostridia bacterium]|nr:hypothetical protein [Clostridia bacterium]